MPDDIVSGRALRCRGYGMGKKVEGIIAKICSDTEIADLLDATLTGPDDRAYIVCLEYDCKKNSRGRCSIHTVRSLRDIPASGRCRDYEA